MTASVIALPNTESSFKPPAPCPICRETGQGCRPYPGGYACSSTRHQDGGTLLALPGRPTWWHPLVESAPSVAHTEAPMDAVREMEALRAALQSTRVELTKARASLDHVEVSGTVQEISRLEHNLKVERGRREQLVRILEATELTHAARVTAALAAEKASAYALRPVFGEEPECSPPAAVCIWELEKQAGIAEGSASRYLTPAADAGLITRTVLRIRAGEGDPNYKSAVEIGPGSGRPGNQPDDRRREHDRDRQANKRRRQEEVEARLRAKVAELEEAANQAAKGCPDCGGELLGTGYLCAECGTNHAVEDLAARWRSRIPACKNPLDGGIHQV